MSSVSNHVRSNYSSDGSLFVSVAHADVSTYATVGDGCGGCCGCDSSDGGTSDASGGTAGGGVGDGSACFSSGTIVSTPDGGKEIQNIIIGDSVYGFDSVTGTIVVSVVTEIMKHSWDEMSADSPLILITHSKGQLTLTTNHPVYKNGAVSKEGFQDFENAGILKVGDMLTTESGEEVAITGISEGPKYDYVYNIEVDKVHTYIAENVRVHNKM